MTERTVWMKDACPLDESELISSRFDTTFRSPDGTEKLSFAVPGQLCKPCRQLYLEPDALELLDVNDDDKCVFAIESDTVQQKRIAPEEPPSSSS